MLRNLLTAILCQIILSNDSTAQPCTPQGDQTTFGTNNVWIGYVYDNMDFTNYMGYITEGTASSPNFNQDFGGPYVNAPTNGCTFYTESFSVRYKLRKNFSLASYTFVVSGDDRIRFSINGGVSWLIDNWAFNSYSPGTVTITLNGTYDLVLEFLENAHQNRVFFNVSQSCVAPATVEAYGSGNTWNAYFYSGINFDTYKGTNAQPGGPGINFTQDFGGSAVNHATSDCSVFTDFFSVRYKIRRNFPANTYTLGVAGDDKYRLSLDGGTSWIIDRWASSSDNTARYFTSSLNGTYDIVLEYFERDGPNYIQFSSTNAIILPLRLESFNARRVADAVWLNWKTSGQESVNSFEIERSTDGTSFKKIGELVAQEAISNYSFADQSAPHGDLYYRIKVVNADGQGAYSRVVMINTEVQHTRIFPTLVTNNVVYLTNSRTLNNASIVISDVTGRTVTKKILGKMAAAQTSSIYLDELRLSRGTFIFQVFDDREMIRTEKIIIP